MAHNCAFCSLESLRGRVIHDDRQSSVVSLLSNPAMTEYHSLVIPRRHVDPAEDVLTEQEIIDSHMEQDKLKDLFQEMGFRGVDIFQKMRPDVAEGANGTKMNHFHTHVIPSRPGSVLYEASLSWGEPGVFQRVAANVMAGQLKNIWETEQRIQHGN